MAVNIIGYVNASYIFDAIELGDGEQEQFLEKFTFDDQSIDLKLVTKFRFNNMLVEFLKGLEDQEPYEGFRMVRGWYPEAKYIDLEA